MVFLLPLKAFSRIFSDTDKRSGPPPALCLSPVPHGLTGSPGQSARATAPGVVGAPLPLRAEAPAAPSSQPPPSLVARGSPDLGGPDFRASPALCTVGALTLISQKGKQTPRERAKPPTGVPRGAAAPALPHCPLQGIQRQPRGVFPGRLVCCPRHSSLVAGRQTKARGTVPRMVSHGPAQPSLSLATQPPGKMVLKSPIIASRKYNMGFIKTAIISIKAHDSIREHLHSSMRKDLEDYHKYVAHNCSLEVIKIPKLVSNNIYKKTFRKCGQHL